MQRPLRVSTSSWLSFPVLPITLALCGCASGEGDGNSADPVTPAPTSPVQAPSSAPTTGASSAPSGQPTPGPSPSAPQPGATPAGPSAGQPPVTPDPTNVTPNSPEPGVTVPEGPTPSEPAAGGAPNAAGGAPNSPSAGGSPPGAAGAPPDGAGGTAPTTPTGSASICPNDPGTAPSGAVSGAELVWEVDEMDYDFHLYEGAAWADGALFFSDINPGGSGGWNSTIYRFDPAAGSATVFLANAGSNGLALGPMGQLYSATAAKKEISVYTFDPAAQQQVIGGMLNSPNDLAVASDGTIYFSDPQQGEIPAGGQPQVVHVVKDGVDSVLTQDIQGPNGVSLSPDESVLYVAGGSSFIKRVTLVDGMAGEITDLATNLSTPDGMTVDCLGNVYVAEHNAVQVRVFSPDGMELATIPLGSARNQDARPTNVAFGGADRKTLYVTATYSLWAVQLDVAGYPN